MASEKFSTDGTKQNIKIVEDIEYNLDLEEYLVGKKKHTRNDEAWTENCARIYNLVLHHCPPELEAQLQNHSSWGAGQSAQDLIALLLMIRDVTHNTKELKEETMALVECVVKLFTTTHKQSESIDDYYKIFVKRKDTLNGMARDAARYAGMVSKLARYIGIQTWSQSTVATKVTIKLAATVSAAPIRPTRKYWVGTLSDP